MPLMTVHCHVAHAEIVRVTDFEGATLRIICGSFDAPSKICRLKMRARESGPLGRLLEGADEGTLGSRGTRCEFG